MDAELLMQIISLSRVYTISRGVVHCSNVWAIPLVLKIRIKSNSVPQPRLPKCVKKLEEPGKKARTHP